jgi:hypothetical protein
MQELGDVVIIDLAGVEVDRCMDCRYLTILPFEPVTAARSRISTGVGQVDRA